MFTLSVFIASFLNKKAYWKIKSFDVVCGTLSVIGLCLWQITKIGNIAIFFSIMADLLATLPTLVKGYNFPDTEMGWPWLLASISGLFTLISIDVWKFEFYGFPLYFFLAMFSLFVFVQLRIGEKVKKIKLKK